MGEEKKKPPIRTPMKNPPSLAPEKKNRGRTRDWYTNMPQKIRSKSHHNPTTTTSDSSKPRA
jgi:hypothetical protein